MDVATIDRIKSEEMNHSRVMEIMSWLSGSIRSRLRMVADATRARDWAMDQMKSWGLADVRRNVEHAARAWVEGKRFSLMALTPAPFIVEAVPQAWSASTKGTVTGPTIRVTSGCLDELKQQFGHGKPECVRHDRAAAQQAGEPVFADRDAVLRFDARCNGGRAARRGWTRRSWRRTGSRAFGDMPSGGNARFHRRRRTRRTRRTRRRTRRDQRRRHEHAALDAGARRVRDPPWRCGARRWRHRDEQWRVAVQQRRR